MEDCQHLLFETNCSVPLSDDFIILLNSWWRPGKKITFANSPKLAVSGEKWEDAIKPDVITDYLTIPGTQVYLKFVVATEEDVEDVKKALNEYRTAGFRGSVYLMPVGGTDEGYFLNNKTVAESLIPYS